MNIYSLSALSWNKVAVRLNRYISEGRVGEYYEAVFAEMVADGTLSFEAVYFDPDRWYEIDTMADLNEAERMCARNIPSPVKPDAQHLQSAWSVPMISITAND